MSSPSVLVQHLSNYCKILRDDGLCYAVAEVERRFSMVKELEAVMSTSLQYANSSALSASAKSILLKAFTGQL